MRYRSTALTGAIALIALLAGCAAPMRDDAARTIDEPARAPSERTPEVARDRPDHDRQQSSLALPGPVRGLVARAESASRAGDHGTAAAQLERALSIAPRHPVLWQNLAVVRYREGDYDQAEALAMKSNAFAGGLTALKRQNWELIATARHLKGDRAGARDAHDKARQFEVGR